LKGFTFFTFSRSHSNWSYDRKMRNGIFTVATLSIFLLSGAVGVCGADSGGGGAPVSFGTFTNPERVTIEGYTQDAMEPFVSLDNQYLFFNDSNSPPPGTFTKLFYATRIDDLTFQFQGEIGGVNTNAMSEVPSMDINNKFYFLSNRSYPTTFSTIYWGDFSAGTVSNVALVPGVSKQKFGWVNFDAGIRPDGMRLYFVDAFYGHGTFPLSAKLTIAKRVGDHFVRLADSNTIMSKVNTGGLNYAPCPTASDLEIFFTRVDPANVGDGPKVYTATLAKKSEPFGKAVKIAAITGFAEGPTITADGKSLYFHQLDGGVFVIYRVSRP
jgi:WD40-like Beta Propeller Repeat